MITDIEVSPILQASTLIEQRTGLAATTQLRADLEMILHRLSQGNIAAFVAKLHISPLSAPCWQKLLDALTIGETYFFRDPTHFRLLKNHILPGLVLRRRQEQRSALNIWSIGCATGEEPYSIAITLHELLGDLSEWYIQLIGTDVNMHSLETARQGFYRQWAFRQPSIIDDGFRHQYFDLKGEMPQVKPHIRKMVTFRHANLMSGPPLPQMDIIFCRNVLIYFKSVQIEAVENMLYNALSPGGWLILGQSEAIRFHRERWITHLFPGAAVYQKPLENRTATTECSSFQKHGQPPLEIIEPQEIPVVGMVSYADAVSALQHDQPELAERYLSDILSSLPGDAPAHMLLASIFANRRALAEAEAHIDTALQIDPLQPDAHYLRAMLHLEQGQITSAKRSLNAALYCQRNHPLASFVLGNLHAQEGDIARAMRAWLNARQAINSLTSESPISDMSDLTAGNLNALIDNQVEGWA